MTAYLVGGFQVNEEVAVEFTFVVRADKAAAHILETWDKRDDGGEFRVGVSSRSIWVPPTFASRALHSSLIP
jgi:hypothetical protein